MEKDRIFARGGEIEVGGGNPPHHFLFLFPDKSRPDSADNPTHLAWLAFKKRHNVSLSPPPNRACQFHCPVPKRPFRSRFLCLSNSFCLCLAGFIFSLSLSLVSPLSAVLQTLLGEASRESLAPTIPKARN
uniref:Uncharacterized protein n=1 Tax=Sphaerodactylus townsendi TaxID=933632 RepID=A0ACB8EED3_9SAUR